MYAIAAMVMSLDDISLTLANDWSLILRAQTNIVDIEKSFHARAFARAKILLSVHTLTYIAGNRFH